jgi:hypothetical protein
VDDFRKKQREYVRNKINELETNRKSKKNRHFYRRINEFKVISLERI